MKKKNYLMSAFAMIMAGMLSIGFASCGGDDDGGGDVRADVAINETNFPDAIFSQLAAQPRLWQ